MNVTVCVRADTFEKREVPDWLRNGLSDYTERFNRETSRSPES